MIKKFLSISLVSLGAFIFQSSAYAQAEYIYSLAQQQNIDMLEQIKSQYGTLDFSDSYGQTALCLSIYRYNYPAFFLLSKLGASRQHSCVRQIHPEHLENFNRRYNVSYLKQKKAPTRLPKQSYMSDSSIFSPTTLAVGGVIGAGALIALASGGGGGGGSGSSATDIGNDGNVSQPPISDPINPPNITPEDPSIDDVENQNPVEPPVIEPENPTTPPEEPIDVPYNLSAKDFQTSEYYRGNFLQHINAAEAYASVYSATKSADGKINIKTDNVETIKVAVVDTGVYKHSDLPEISGGYNFDYGPCQNSSQTQCWVYKDSFWSSGIAFRDENGKETIIYEGTESDFEYYKKQYDSSYRWEDNKFVYTPLNDTHGTHVSGIISAIKNGTGMHGVAQNVELLPIRYDFNSNLIDPVKTAVDNGVKVINASFGSAADEDYNAAMKTSVWKTVIGNKLSGYEYLAQKQTALLVMAAGNDSNDEPSIDAGAGLHVDGLKDVMLTVVATKTSNPTQLSSYSNNCGSTSSYCLAAPGGDNDLGVISTVDNNNLEASMGTSMATPVVSGSAAFLWGAYPNLKASDVASILLETATDIGAVGVDNVYGHGLLNLNDAVNKPLGKPVLATTNSINGEKIQLTESKLRIPASLRTQILKALPASVSVLDKYERSFQVPIKSFVKSALHNPATFRNKLKRFTSFEMKRHVHPTPGISFGFTETTNQKSDFGVGELDVSFNFDKNNLRFYFIEDTHHLSEKGKMPKINPFTKMNNAYGIEDQLKITDKLKVKANFVSGENAFYETDLDKDYAFDKQVFAFDTELNYQPINGISIGFSAGALYEKDSLLGLNGGGAFDVQNSQTYYFGLSAELNPIPNFYLTGAYYLGLTQKEKQTAFLTTSNLHSDGFFVNAYYQLSDSDYLGLSLTSPLRIKKGYAVFDLPTGRDYYSDTIYRERYVSELKPDARELDYALYYGKKINSQMQFKTQGGVRVHPNHQKDANNDYQFLFGFDWKFN